MVSCERMFTRLRSYLELEYAETALYMLFAAPATRKGQQGGLDSAFFVFDGAGRPQTAILGLISR